MTIRFPEEERASLEIERDLRSAMLFRHFASTVENLVRAEVRVVAP
jgi:hypothetical protein